MKKITAIILVLLMAVQFADAAFGEELPGGTKFSEMEYIRPEPENVLTAAEAVTVAIENGEDTENVEELLEIFFMEYNHFYTMQAIAQIRYFQDMSDEFYYREYTLCGEMIGTIEMAAEKMYIACAHCDHAQQLAADYFWDGFLDEYGGDFAGRYNDTVVTLKLLERELIDEYYALSADPVVNLNGKDKELSAALAAADDEDYYNILMEYYRQYNESYAEILIALVKLRHVLAWEMGYKDVWDMQCDTFDRDFSRAQATAFLNDTVLKIVPVYKQVLERGKAVDGLLLDEQTLMEIMDAVMSDVGSYTDEAYKYMKEYELYDISASENKAQISFTSYLKSYEEPFIFIAGESTEADLFGFSHEFGHFAQMYASFNGLKSLDLSEYYSQAMEMLLISRAGEVLEEEYAELLRVYKMSDILTTYIQQGMFACFEELVYSIDPEQLNTEALNFLCLKCAEQFGITEYYDEEYCSMLWSDVAHFYEYPFYVISYPVSEDAAMQIYEAELESTGLGAEIYDAMLPYENMRLLEALESAGLSSPFDSGRLDRTADILREVLINASDERAA